MNVKKLIALTAAGLILFGAGVGVGTFMRREAPKEAESAGQVGYAAKPAYEYIAGAAAWQMSAEANSLMMQ